MCFASSFWAIAIIVCPACQRRIHITRKAASIWDFAWSTIFVRCERNGITWILTCESVCIRAASCLVSLEHANGSTIFGQTMSASRIAWKRPVYLGMLSAEDIVMDYFVILPLFTAKSMWRNKRWTYSKINIFMKLAPKKPNTMSSLLKIILKRSWYHRSITQIHM